MSLRWSLWRPTLRINQGESEGEEGGEQPSEKSTETIRAKGEKARARITEEKSPGQELGRQKKTEQI